MILNYLQEKIEYTTSQRKEILGEIQDIMHYVLDADTVAYRKDGENVKGSEIRMKKVEWVEQEPLHGEIESWEAVIDGWTLIAVLEEEDDNYEESWVWRATDPFGNGDSDIADTREEAMRMAESLYHRSAQRIAKEIERGREKFQEFEEALEADGYPWEIAKKREEL